MSTTPFERARTVEPADIVVGLGCADRAFLSLCIALFEDTSLLKRIGGWYDNMVVHIQQPKGDQISREAVESVRTSAAVWMESKLSDDQMRLALWVYLRTAFACVPKLALSERRAASAADDLTAAIIHFVDPPEGFVGTAKKAVGQVIGKPVSERRVRASLSDVAMDTIESLLATALKDETGQMPAAEKDKLVAGLRASLQELDEPTRKRLLEKVGADDLNDAAIIKILALGGGLTSLSAAVGLSGFAAYILAAQASAFIPLVSGPMLVSLLSVLSNPITAVVGTVLGAAWLKASVDERVRAQVAVRVASLLALQGLGNGKRDFKGALRAFANATDLPAHGALADKVIAPYRTEWKRVAPAANSRTSKLDRAVATLMERTIADDGAVGGRLRRLLFPGDDGAADTAAVAAMTIGDVLYSAAMIDPAVVAAADFSRADAIEGRVDFAAFAHKVRDLAPTSYAGAESNLSGYVAEQVVAARLIEQGHQVSFPETSNQQGWDLMVDGQPFQVKCYEDASGLAGHFDKNPDIPVLVNAELAGHVPDEYAAKVFFVEGYSHELVGEITDRSLEAGADMLDPDVPVFAIGVSAVRNLMGYRAGQVTGAQAAEQVLLDGATRAGLAAAGGYVGVGIGLMVFGPAGALVFGSALPVLSQAQSGRVRKILDKTVGGDVYDGWAAKAECSLRALVAAMFSALQVKLGLLQDKRASLPEGPAGDYVRARIDDDLVALRELELDLTLASADANDRTVEVRVLDVVRWSTHSTIHPVVIQAPLKELADCMSRRPTLGERAADVAREGLERVADLAGKGIEALGRLWRSGKDK